jgi:GntR family transcriptional regulator
MLEGIPVPMKYERIAADIIADIRAGRLKPGDNIPTIKELKARYGVGYYTIRELHLYLKSQLLLEKGTKRLEIGSMAPYMIR